MQEVTYARLKRLLADAVEMETMDGRLVLLDRADIDDPEKLNAKNEDQLADYFKEHPTLMVVCTRIDETKKRLIAKRFSFLSDPWLRRVSQYEHDEPLEMVILDTNSKNYAYGEIASGIEGKCSKLSIRRFLKKRRILPPRQPEGHDMVGRNELMSAGLADGNFWELYYPQFELYPGDVVIGCMSGIHYDPESEDYCVLLDVPRYLERLKQHRTDIFPRLGLALPRSAAAERLVRSVFQERSPVGTPPRTYHSILIVDDHVSETLEPLTRLLRHDRFDVTSCSDERQADRAIAKTLHAPGDAHFDLAIIDIHLAETRSVKDYRGLGLARRLQKSMPHCGIVLVSGEGTCSTNGAKQQAAGDLRVLDYLHKPFTAAAFRRRLRALAGREPTLARDLFKTVQHPDDNIAKRLRENKRLQLERLRDILERMRSELTADTVALFRMHKISRSVSIVDLAGESFPKYREELKGLRYSPVRDVCEDGEAWCHNQAPDQWFAKHCNLLSICAPGDLYTDCVACPVVEPPGDDHWYALFAFAFSRFLDSGEFPGFRIRGQAVEDMPTNELSEVRNVLACCLSREYASYVAQHLLEVWHESTQIRQYPFLMTGMSVSAMGHDLANLLTGSDHELTVLAEQLAADRTIEEEHRKSLNLLQSMSTRAMSIAQSFGQHARSQEEKPAKFKLRDAIQAAFQAVSFEAERNRVAVHWHGDPGLHLTCRRRSLERIIFNLFLNASQQIGLSFWHSGIVQAKYFLRDKRDAKELVIQIYDNGPGIQTHRLNRIFDAGETTRPDGSGMGLAIARQEMEAQRGSIRVAKSVLFCGSCFELVLPPKVLVCAKEGR